MKKVKLSGGQKDNPRVLQVLQGYQVNASGKDEKAEGEIMIPAVLILKRLFK